MWFNLAGQPLHLGSFAEGRDCWKTPTSPSHCEKKQLAEAGSGPFSPRCAAKHQVFAKTFQLQSHKTAITPVLFALRLQNDPVHAALREWWSERFYCNDLL